jgi:hypothetical protein
VAKLRALYARPANGCAVCHFYVCSANAHFSNQM